MKNRRNMNVGEGPSLKQFAVKIRIK